MRDVDPSDVFDRLISLSCLGPFIALGVIVLIIGLVVLARREPYQSAYQNTWRMLYRSRFMPPGYYPHPLAFRELVVARNRASAGYILRLGLGLLLGCLASGAFILAGPRPPEAPSPALLILALIPPMLGAMLGFAWSAVSGPRQRDSLSRLQLLAQGLHLGPRWVVALSLMALAPGGIAMGAAAFLTTGRVIGWLAIRPSYPDSFDASQAAFLSAYPWALWIAPCSGLVFIALPLFALFRLRAIPMMRTADPQLSLASGRQWQVQMLAGSFVLTQFVGMTANLQAQVLQLENFGLTSLLILLGIFSILAALIWPIVMLRLYFGQVLILAPWPPQPAPRPTPQAPPAGG